MNHDFTIEFRGTFLYVLHSPGYVINPESEEAFWMAIIKACKVHKCDRVLREGEGVVRKMAMVDNYQTAKLVSRITRGLRVAIFFKDYEPDELSRFFQTAAANRGVAIEYFNDRDSALRWLGVGRAVA